MEASFANGRKSSAAASQANKRFLHFLPARSLHSSLCLHWLQRVDGWRACARHVADEDVYVAHAVYVCACASGATCRRLTRRRDDDDDDVDDRNVRCAVRGAPYGLLQA